MRSWQNKKNEDLTLTFVTDGIFSAGDLLYKSDSYTSRIKQLLRKRHRKFQNREDDQWAITIDETLTMIGGKKRQLEYLERGLSGDYPDGYQVEMNFQGKVVKIIRVAELGARSTQCSANA